MATRTPPFPNYPKWSTAKFWSFIRSGLRAKWSRWPPKYEALAAAKRGYKGPNKLQKYEYKCSQCKKYHKQKDVEVDHIVPCGTLKCVEDLPEFVSKMFVGTEKLRVVCKPCHRGLTNEERESKKRKEVSSNEE